jgi:hypothetical protein
MGKIKSWEVSDRFWERVERVIGKKKRNKNKKYVITESIYEGKIQRVIRMKDKLYYSAYNWCDQSLPEEIIWELRPKGDPKQLEGEAFSKASNIFNKIVTDLNLVGPGDDPLEFYGTS